MRILMIGFNMPFYGNYRRASHFGAELVRRGHEVILMITSARNQKKVVIDNSGGLQIVEMPDLLRGSLRSGWDLWNIANRLYWLKGKQFDLIHGFECRPTVIYPALFATRKGTPLIIDWADWFGQGGSVEERPNWLIRTLLRPVETFHEENFRPHVQGNTVICSTLYQKALSIGVPAARLIQIPDGCDPYSIYPGDRFEARRRLGLPLEGEYVGYLGSAFQQDVQFMAESFHRVRLAHPTAHLLWFGARPASSTHWLERQAHIHVFGRFPQQEMNTFLSALDIGWIPLRDTPANRGRWPSKINEYMSAGLPVVSTSVGDMQSFIGENGIGLLAQDNPADFAAQTVTYLQNPDLRLRAGYKARLLAENEMSWSHLTGRLEEFYLNIL